MNPAVESYLAEIERRLPRGRRVRADVLDELRDGLMTAIESQPADPGETNHVARVIAAFGDPTDVASRLSDEIRLRRARRSAIELLLALSLMGVLWRVYDATVGTEPTMVPDRGFAHDAFLVSVAAIGFAAVTAQAAAGAFVAITSIRASHAWTSAARRCLAIAAVAATSAFSLSALLILATISPRHPAQAAIAGPPAIALLVAMLMSTTRLARHA